MYWDKTDIKFLNKINRNVISRKTKYFSRPLHIDGKPTKIKIIKLKSWEALGNEIKGFVFLPDKICYLLPHIFLKSIDTINEDVELIITNLKNEIIEIKTDLTVNHQFKFSRPVNLWFFKKNSIEFMNLKLKDIINTR